MTRPKSFGFPPIVILSNPEAIEQVFSTPPELFEVGKQTTLPIRVLLGDNSLVLMDGIQHQKASKLLMPPFHGERMKSYGNTIVEVTKQVISSWQIGKPFSIRDYTQEISLRVILRTIFGLVAIEIFSTFKNIKINNCGGVRCSWSDK